MKRPVGLWFVIAWCILRGVGGIWGSVTLARWVLRGYGTWRETFFVFVFEGAIWIWLAITLSTGWNVGRLATIFWCAVIIIWASHGFYIAALPRWNQLQYGGRYGLTVATHAAVIVYLLRPSLARFYKFSESAAAQAPR